MKMIHLSAIGDKKFKSTDKLMINEEVASFKELADYLKCFENEFHESVKDKLPLFSCAKYADGTSRLIENVEYQTVLIFDFDDKTTDINILKSIPFNKIFYRSFSWTPTTQKLRMLVEIDQPITNEVWFKETYEVLGKILLALGQQYDRSCNDFARYLYIPCTNTASGYGAEVEYHHTGRTMRVGAFKTVQVIPTIQKPLNPPTAQTSTVSKPVSASINAGIYYISPTDNNWFKNLSKIYQKIEDYKNGPEGSHHNGIFKLACSVRSSFAAKWKRDLPQYDLLQFMTDVDFADPNGFASNHGRRVKENGIYKIIDCKNTVSNAVQSVYAKYPNITF